VAGLEAVEVPAHHRAGEAAADRSADDVDELTGHEAAGHQSALTSMTASLATRNSTSFFFGSTLAQQRPRIGWVTFFTLPPRPSWTAVYLSFFRADGDNLQRINLQNGDGHVFARVAGRVMPNLLGDETATHGLSFPVARRSGVELDFDVDARGGSAHQRVHRLRRRVDDIEHPLVGADLRTARATSSMWAND
jgi:hypothetical protein